MKLYAGLKVYFIIYMFVVVTIRIDDILCLLMIIVTYIY